MTMTLPAIPIRPRRHDLHEWTVACWRGSLHDDWSDGMDASGVSSSTPCQQRPGTPKQETERASSKSSVHDGACMSIPAEPVLVWAELLAVRSVVARQSAVCRRRLCATSKFPTHNPALRIHAHRWTECNNRQQAATPLSFRADVT